MNIESLLEYKNYLTNILGYSNKTIATYLFYVQKLLYYKSNYLILMNSYLTKTNNTKRVMLSAIKNYYKFKDNETRNKIVLPKKEKNVKDHISFDEYNKLLNILLAKPKKYFQKILIIKILFETGIRSSELLGIKVEHINEQKIIINGKNKKQRIIYVSLNLLNLINDYIFLKKLSPWNFLFDFNYRNLHKHINYLGNLINKKLTPHMFRRGFATYCLDKNIGIYEISLMMGHENINTTKTYLRNEYKIEIMKSIFDN